MEDSVLGTTVKEKDLGVTISTDIKAKQRVNMYTELKDSFIRGCHFMKMGARVRACTCTCVCAYVRTCVCACVRACMRACVEMVSGHLRWRT